jgi:hypothetical protein
MAPRIYFSGGDVMLEGFGRLDEGAQEHLAEVTKDEFFAAMKAKDVEAFRAAKVVAKALSKARHEAHRWMRAAGSVAQ